MSTVEPSRTLPAPVCPICQGALTMVSKTRLGGRRFHAELQLLECPEHGHVFVTRQGVAGPGPSLDDSPGRGDAPALVPRSSPRSPLAGAAAIPEPDT